LLEVFKSDTEKIEVHVIKSTSEKAEEISCKMGAFVYGSESPSGVTSTHMEPYEIDNALVTG